MLVIHISQNEMLALHDHAKHWRELPAGERTKTRARVLDSTLRKREIPEAPMQRFTRDFINSLSKKGVNYL